MNRKSLIVLIFAVTLVIAPAARAQILSPDSGGGGRAYKANSRPAGMSQAEYRALMLRGAALNARYGNPLTDMSPQQFRAAYLAGIAYANGVSSSDVQPTDSSGSTFNWRYVGIAALGAMLLAWTSVVFTRRRHQPSF